MIARELPLPDYASLPVGSIESRARTLGHSWCPALLHYENEARWPGGRSRSCCGTACTPSSEATSTLLVAVPSPVRPRRAGTCPA